MVDIVVKLHYQAGERLVEILDTGWPPVPYGGSFRQAAKECWTAHSQSTETCR